VFLPANVHNFSGFEKGKTPIFSGFRRKSKLCSKPVRRAALLILFIFGLKLPRMDISIRKGTKQDLPQVLILIKELAEYERALHEVSNTVEQMEMDGFGKDPLFGFFVAETDGKIVGMALYYYRYSTWKGKRMYLEDIIVTEEYRRKRIGRLLFKAIMQQALDDNCSGMMWQVLDWNEPAIGFYKKYDSEFHYDWVNCNLDIEKIKSFL
jgi:GNAT superfamily N-acetyltransferase